MSNQQQSSSSKTCATCGGVKADGYVTDSHYFEGDCIRELQSQNASLLERVAAAEKEKDTYRLALESLTPGGSEFVNDAERCVAHVKERQTSQHRQIVKLSKENTALQFQLASARQQAMEFAEVVYYLESKHVDLTNNWRVLKMNLLTNMPSEFVMDAVDYLLFVGRLEKHTENEWYRLIKSATQAAPAEEVKG